MDSNSLPDSGMQVPVVDCVSDVSIPGPDGRRVEGRFTSTDDPEAPIALVFAPDPRFGGTMNNRVVLGLHRAFQSAGFAALRINYRCVGRSQGVQTDDGSGEISDATTATAFLQAERPRARECWVAGYSFGAWVALQLIMRRPELAGFIVISPPVNLYDFTFLSPCPASGLIVTGRADKTVPKRDSMELISRLVDQERTQIAHSVIPRANHFYEEGLDRLVSTVTRYLNRTSKSGF